MLEIRLVGPSPGAPHQRLYRESMSFTSLELETKSYTKILKNKKVRAKSLRGGRFAQTPPPFARQCFGPLSSFRAGKHENQLFISVWNRETGKLRGFGSILAAKQQILGKMSCFRSRCRTKTSPFSNFPVPNAHKKLIFVFFSFQRTYPMFFMI